MMLLGLLSYPHRRGVLKKQGYIVILKDIVLNHKLQYNFALHAIKSYPAYA